LQLKAAEFRLSSV